LFSAICIEASIPASIILHHHILGGLKPAADPPPLLPSYAIKMNYVISVRLPYKT